MNKKRFFPYFLIAMLLLAACTPSLANAYSNTYPENTQPAATATENLPAVPTATESPAATPTQAPTLAPTQIPTLQPSPTLAQPTVSVPCNLAGFVGDVTIPDGSLLDPGASYTKTWRLQNLGSCSWTTGYALVFSSGDLMSGPTVVALPQNVNPGDTIDVSANLVAPTTAGTYQGDWMLRDASGNIFGVGTNGSQHFWVRIVVNSSVVFAMTEVDTSVSPTTYSGVCPVTFSFDANIWTNGAGTVTYHWLRSDGSTSPEGTLTFTAAGYQTVSESWTLGDPGSSINGSDQIYIDTPNNQSFSAEVFTLTCDPVATDSPTPTPTLTPTATFTETPTPTQPASTNTPTPTQPAPTKTATPTQPAPTNTPAPTQPAPTQTTTPTQPAPTQTTAPTQPAPTQTSTPTQPAATQTPTPTQTLKP